MSFSLSLSGHHPTADTAAELDSQIVANAKDLVNAILDQAPDVSSLSCIFSGPSGSVNIADEVRNARAAAEVADDGGDHGDDASG